MVQLSELGRAPSISLCHYKRGVGVVQRAFLRSMLLCGEPLGDRVSPYNVGVVQLFEQGHLSDDAPRHALFPSMAAVVIQSELLQGHCLPCQPVSCLQHQGRLAPNVAQPCARSTRQRGKHVHCGVQSAAYGQSLPKRVASKLCTAGQGPARTL